jgi:hypothetical protein
MLVKDILQKLDLGNSVAEFDAALESYFVETQTFREVINDRGDIVAGDKGTGKTAMFRILQARASRLPQLDGIQIVPAFNPTGSSIFQRLTESQPLDEPAYVALWKVYVLALVGNWILGREHKRTESVARLDDLLTGSDLKSIDHTPTSIFGKIVEWIAKSLRTTKSAQIAFSFSESGAPVVTPKIDFSDAKAPDNPTVRVEDAFGVLNSALSDLGLKVWVALDRLDEAFQGAPAAEVPALRALFRTYLDLMPFERARLKLFVRRDLFRKVTHGGFVNLTHVNARKIEIRWDEEDLKDLLFKRVRENREFLEDMDLLQAPNEEGFQRIFPQQVDPGERKPATWTWMMSRIRDGNGVKPPRNLIDLVRKSLDAQLRREDREAPNAYAKGDPLIGPEALKRGLKALSEERVNDTLLAEAGDYAKVIERFRNNKADHNEASLATVLGTSVEDARKHAEQLCELGFLEQIGGSYKVPPLYRDGLGITQGKAY